MKKLTLVLLLVFTSTAYAQPIINQPDDIIQFEFPFDGFATFDLTVNETDMLNGIDPSTVSIFYYLTLADAQSQSNPVANPTNWSNTTNPETIFVNVRDIATTLFSTTNFEIQVSNDVVNIPDPDFLQSIIDQGVDTNNSSNIQSFEAQSVTILNINEQVLNVTGLEAFTNVIELSSNFNDFSSFDLSSLLSLEILDITTVFGSGGILNLSSNINLKILNLQNTTTTTTSLDLSSNTLLEELTIWSSNLTTLDLNNNSNLLYLNISNNQLLETVFIKNGSDESTNIDSGSWLENWGFGNNPSLQYVCADANQVQEIQGFAQGSYVVNSFCDFQPGGDFNTVTGVVQFDVDNDGCDASDPVVPFLNIEAGFGPATLVPAVTSDSNGVYNIYFGQTGDFTVQPYLENPFYFIINPSFPSVNIPFIDNSITAQDFCLTANGVVADAEVVIAPIFPSRPGFDATYQLVYKNKGNQTVSGTVNFEYDDAVLDFISATTIPDVESTGVLTFNYTDLQPFESIAIGITLNVNGPTETPAINIDDVLDYTSTITIDQTEETPADNIFNYSEVVVGSYDPNDITCLQGDIAPDALIGEFLHYIIRFENTGNAPAENVVVETEINVEDYDINTLQVLNASADMSVNVTTDLIEFKFENINLDSGGHGNILLKIKTKSDLFTGDAVEAKADIYFDFNFPITTNTANTTFSSLSVDGFLPDIEISIYPNPTESVVFIEADSNIQSISVYDIKGRRILHNEPKKNKTNLNLSSFDTGIYFMRIKTNNGEVTKKIIKN